MKTTLGEVFELFAAYDMGYADLMFALAISAEGNGDWVETRRVRAVGPRWRGGRTSSLVKKGLAEVVPHRAGKSAGVPQRSRVRLTPLGEEAVAEIVAWAEERGLGL